LVQSSPAATRLDTANNKLGSALAVEKENKKKTVKRPSKAKILEAAGLQLWIDGNKESLQEQFGDVTEDEFCKQCASVFKKLPKEERKEWIARAKEQEKVKEGDKQMKKRGRSLSSTDAMKPSRQQQQTLKYFSKKTDSLNEKETEATEEANDKSEKEDELESPSKKSKTETVASKLSQFVYNRDE
jgi:hypothetical protein